MNSSLLNSLLARFARKTWSTRYIPEIDGLRFIAILWVVIFHIHVYAKSKVLISFVNDPNQSLLSRYPTLGVPLFFAISGFLLALPFAEHYIYNSSRIKLRSYYWRRITRLEPPYIINIIVLFVLLIIIQKQDALGLFPHLVTSLLYIHNVTFNEFSLINGVAWSLEVEVQFYIIAPFLAIVFKLPRTFRWLVFVVLIVLFPILQFKFGWSKLTILGQLHYFFAGFLLAEAYLDYQLESVSSYSWIYDLIGVVALGIMPLPLIWFNEMIGKIIVSFLIFALCFSVFNGKVLPKILSNRWITTIGGMCYSIYLWHYFVISFMGRFTSHIHLTSFYLPNLLLQLFVIIPLIFVVCGILFITLEKPFMNRRWPNSLCQKIRSYYSLTSRKFQST